MWQSGTDGSPQREKWEESRKLYFIEEIGVRLGANLTKNETSVPGISLTGGLARKGKWLCARAGDGRAVSSWVTSHCPNCEMKVVPLPAPGILRDTSRDIQWASPSPEVALSCPLLSPFTVHKTFQESVTVIMRILRPRKGKRFFLLLFLTLNQELKK